MIFCHLRVPGVHVYENCYPGALCHPLTDVEGGRFQGRPKTNLEQIWYLISVAFKVDPYEILALLPAATKRLEDLRNITGIISGVEQELLVYSIHPKG